ncbi:MAG: MnhB domain-containing protein [Candidatus Margulisiibacteriota bacterium]|nr:MnhB domain-containing protein [Candidatus Margulisiibacteriota bacterium]
MNRKSAIVKVFTRKLFPFILLYGCYLISHGHLSPGGGFQGGVIFGSALILLGLVEGVALAEKRFKEDFLSLAKNIGMLIFILVGFTGMILGYSFLSDFLPQGEVGTVPGAGLILFLNLTIGFMVGTGIAVIFYRMVRHGS